MRHLDIAVAPSKICIYMLLRLTDNQLQKLADIASDTGLVALGSVVIPAVFDHMNVKQMTLGIIATIFL